MSTSTRTKNRLWLLVWMLPAFLLAILLFRYAVDLPAGDEWYTPGDLFLRLAGDEPPTFDDLISQHNESRTTFPRLIFWGLAEIIGWNTRGELALMFVMVIGIALSVLKLNRSTVANRTWGSVAFALSCLLLFSPSQWENWAYTIQLVVFLSILCIVMCLWIAQSSMDYRYKLVLTALLSTIATFSSASGMLCWGVTFGALFLKAAVLRLPPRSNGESGPAPGVLTTATDLAATPRQAWVGFILWMAAWAGNLVLYFHDFEKPAGIPRIDDPLQQPFEAAKFLFALAGSILGGGSVELSEVVGFVAVVLFAALVGWAWRTDRSSSFEWMILGAYALLIDVIITRGRFPHGPPSRYQSFSLYIWISIFHLAAIVLPGVVSTSDSRRWWKRSLVACMTALLMLHFWSFAAGARLIADVSHDRQQGKACLTFVNVFQDGPCFSESIRIGLEPHILDRIHAANRLGFLEPPLESERDLRVLAGSRASAGSFDEARLRRVGEDWEISVSGRLHQCDGCGSGDAVLLAWEAPDGSAVPFTAVRVGMPYENFGQVVRRLTNREDDWSASFSLDEVARDPELRLLIEQSPRITAYSFDSNTGRVHPLEGSFPFPIRP